MDKLERRIANPYIQLDLIPKSAEAWDGITDTSPSGNTFYIPLYRDNIATVTYYSNGQIYYASFPYNLGLSDNISYSVLIFGSNVRPYTEDANVYRPGYASGKYLILADNIGTININSSEEPTIRDNNPVVLASSYNSDTSYKNYLRGVSLAPCYIMYYTSNYTSKPSSFSSALGLFPNGYIKLVTSDGSTTQISSLGTSVGSNSNFRNFSGWPYPIYVDTE